MAAHLSEGSRRGPTRHRLLRGALLVAIVVGGLWLRVGGADFGAPSAFARPDEELGIREALFLLGGDPHVHFHSYGDGWPRLLAAVYRLEGRDVGERGENAPPIVAWMTDPLPFHRSARIVSAVLGALTILLAWGLAGRWGGPRAGLWAAGVQATAPLAVLHAHFATVDTLGAFLVAAAVLVTAAGRGAMSRSLAAGIAGAAAGVKLPFALVLAAPYLALRGARTSRFTGAAFITVAFLAGLVATSPSWLTEPALVWQRLVAEGVSQASRRGDLGAVASGMHLFRWSFWAGLAPVGVLAALGAARAVASRPSGGLPYILGAAWLVFHAVTGAPFSRYLLPALPLLAGAAGVGLARWQERLPAGLDVLLVATLVYTALGPSLEIRGALGRTDTRGELLQAFASGRLPRDAYVVLPGHLFGLAPPAADLTLRGTCLSGPGGDCVQRTRQWEAAARELEGLPTPRPVWEHLEPTDEDRLTLDDLPSGTELLVAFLWSDGLFMPGWSGEGARKRVFRDIRRSAEAGRIRFRLLWSADPGLGASRFYEPWDFWFVPVLDPAIQRRPGPRIEVWSVRKKE